MEDIRTEKIISYLQGRLDREGADEFYAWVNADAGNKKLFFEVKAMYDGCLSSGTPLDAEKSWLRLLRRQKAGRFTLWNVWRQTATYAAVALIAVAFTSAFFLFLPENKENHLTRYIGGDGLEADVVELPDGTRVSLGTKTSFHYNADYGEKQRIVYLEGEAYFDVAKEKDKPFIVRTGEQDIEALGTQFNVSAYPQDSLLITTLLRGSVLLTTGDSTPQTLLRPNEQFVYNRIAHSGSVQQVDASQFTAWTMGYYYFPEQNLKTILDRLGHVYGVEFTVKSAVLNERRFTGTFYRGQSIKDIMEIVHLSIPIRYEVKGQQVSISAIE